MISFFTSSKITTTISCLRYLRSSIKNSAALLGDNILCFLSAIGLELLFINSQTAFNCIALILPIPLIFCNSAKDTSFKKASPLES